jgi:hypothetical protein
MAYNNYVSDFLKAAAAAIVLTMLAPARGWAICSTHGSASSTPTQVVPANDTVVDRRFLFIQNTGSSSMNFAIGTNNKATTADIYLPPGASMVFTNFGGVVPSGDVSVVSSLSTTWAFCDY